MKVKQRPFAETLFASGKNIPGNIQSFLWLGVGAVSFLLLLFNILTPITGLLIPLFFLRFVRMQTPLKGLGFLAATFCILIVFLCYMRFPVFVFAHVVMGIVMGIISIIPYLLDKLQYRRLQGLSSTLAFPLAVTALEYILAKSPSSGSWGSMAYTQYGNLPLMQLASITGIFGITFLIAWFGSMINFIWEHNFVWDRIKKPTIVFVSVVLLIFTYGFLRLHLPDKADKTVRIAAITSPPQYRDRFVEWLLKGTCPFDLQKSKEFLESYTKKAVDSGAKIVAWQEYADLIARDHEKKYTAFGQELAQKNNIYLLLGIGVLNNRPGNKSRNKVILIDPSGKIVWDYSKSYLVPEIEEPFFIKGDKKIPFHQTPYGKIASVICFDFDLQAYIQNAGKNKTDIMLVPSLDWKEITPLHSNMAIFRAIENGFSFVRPVGHGLSIASDPFGRVIEKQNYFESENRIMIADIPMKRETTIYAHIGDLFAHLSIAGFLLLFTYTIVRGKKAQ